MAKTKLFLSIDFGDIVFSKNTTGNRVTSKRAIVTALKKFSDNPNLFYIVKPISEQGTVAVDTDYMDTWDKRIYSGSEGAIYVGDLKGTAKYEVVRRQFVTQSPETLADIVLSMLAKDWPHNHIQEAEDSAVVWREATEEECNNPKIKWEMEGESKYGRRMINRKLHIYRGLTMSEFYGGGIVD